MDPRREFALHEYNLTKGDKTDWGADPNHGTNTNGDCLLSPGRKKIEEHTTVDKEKVWLGGKKSGLRRRKGLRAELK